MLTIPRSNLTYGIGTDASVKQFCAFLVQLHEYKAITPAP